MVAACVAALLLVQPQSPIKVGRYDMGERLKRLDVTWLNVSENSRRKDAVEQVRLAVMSFFGNKYGEACARLDAATEALLGNPPNLADAVSVRFLPPVVQPGKKAKLFAYWAYAPEDIAPISVGVGSANGLLKPGETLELEVDPPLPVGVSAESAQTKEYGILVNVAVGTKTQSAYLTIGENLLSRTNLLLDSTSDTARAIARQVKTYLEVPESAEQDIPVLDHISMAESLHTGERKIWQYSHLPISYHRNTYFRASFPKSLMAEPEKTPPVTVVIAFHGAGGSENLFFEGYGRGIAATEALKRGWVFVAPRVSSSGPEDVYDWLVNVRKVKVKQIFAMGHSMGGAEAVRCVTLPTPSSGVALFSPAAAAFPEAYTNQPMFLTIGAQDIPALLRSARSLDRILNAKPKFEYKEYDPCEHLMIVGTAMKDAYARFDQWAMLSR